MDKYDMKSGLLEDLIEAMMGMGDDKGEAMSDEGSSKDKDEPMSGKLTIMAMGKPSMEDNDESEDKMSAMLGGKGDDEEDDDKSFLSKMMSR